MFLIQYFSVNNLLLFLVVGFVIIDKWVIKSHKIVGISFFFYIFDAN